MYLVCRTFEGGAEGVTVAFTAGILGKREGRSVRDRSDAIWSAAENAVLTVARRFQQVPLTYLTEHFLRNAPSLPSVTSI